MIIVAQQHEKTPKSVAWMSPLLGHWVSGPAAPAVGPRIKASFLGFSSWPQCSSDRGGETRSGSSGPHSHTGDRMPCCTILETSPCNKKRKRSTLMVTMLIKTFAMRALEVRPHLRSTLEIWVSLVLPVPQGSRRYCDSSTTPLTAPMRGLSSCSTDTHTSAHEPLHRSVRHDLWGCRDTNR